MTKWLIVIGILLAAGGAAWAKYGKFFRSYKDYETLLAAFYDGTVPLVYSKDLVHWNNYYLLDSREPNEYKVSHLAKARYIGYNVVDWQALAGISKTDTIVVYCSVGYRSEKIGEQLKAKGFTNVYNLYGGIFQWVNEGRTILDSQGKITNRVHGYDANWGKWIKKGVVVYDK